MVNIDYGKNFLRYYQKLDKSIKDQIKKIIIKIMENPEIGKPMRYARKGTRELYIGSHRLSYAYIQKENKIIFLNLYHKNKQ